MNEASLRRLEFDKVRARLAAYCGTDMGRALAESLEASANPLVVSELLAETTEARRFLDTKGRLWDFGGLQDASGAVENLRAGIILEPMEIEILRRVLVFAAKVRSERPDAERYPVIAELAGELFAHPALVKRMGEVVDETGTVRDGASDDLRRLRRRLRHLESAVPEKLRRFLIDDAGDPAVRDRIVTIRNGRYVVPIRSEFLGRGSWILQDRSSSGATSFVEPMEAVDDNNELIQTRIEERNEVLRVLREMSAALREFEDPVAETLDRIGRLDFLLAKGDYSIATKAAEANIAPDGVADIIRGRHPLLTGDVIPVDLAIGGRTRALILTGPNAGGKTVAMKMLGLFALMNQAGLHIPAAEGTALPVFSDVLAVIGDDQSIEANLSTFSSHLTELNNITERAHGGCLVLVDEICSGTDPEEGTALACGALKEWMSAGAICLVTSHQSGLKNFASVTEGASNARVLFDEATGAPRYMVEIGAPGKSHALEIARRLGFPERILASARGYLSAASRMAERLLADIEKMKSFIEVERGGIESARKDAEKKRREAETKLEKAARERENIVLSAMREAEKVVEETRLRCMDILRQAHSAVTLPVTAAVKGELKKLERKVDKKTRAVLPDVPVNPRELKPGLWLRLRDTREAAQYIEPTDRRGMVRVQCGPFTVTTRVDNLALHESPPAHPPSAPRPQYRDFINAAIRTAKTEIDLHGMRALEAVETLEREIENLRLAGAHEVFVVHGVGTGALRKAVAEYLTNNPFIEHFEPADLSRGGIGATRVLLR